MTLIDFILNVAAVLLWLNWRSLSHDALAKGTPATLVGTLRRAEPSRLRRWHPLAGLAALLLVRAWIYWQIGPSVNWTPNLHLGAIAVAFRSDYFNRMLLFSALSFAVTLAVFYLWLLLLSLVNGRSVETDPLQRLTRLQLGFVDRWPWWIKLLLPLALSIAFWLLLDPLLAWYKIIPSALSIRHKLEQGVVIGLGSYLTWRFIIAVLLMLWLVSSYVYLGNHWFWRFVSTTGRNLVAPLRWLPLRLGKVDFAPLLGIIIVLVGAEYADRGLTALYERLPL